MRRASDGRFASPPPVLSVSTLSGGQTPATVSSAGTPSGGQAPAGGSVADADSFLLANCIRCGPRPKVDVGAAPTMKEATEHANILRRASEVTAVIRDLRSEFPQTFAACLGGSPEASAASAVELVDLGAVVIATLGAVAESVRSFMDVGRQDAKVAGGMSSRLVADLDNEMAEYLRLAVGQDTITVILDQVELIAGLAPVDQVFAAMLRARATEGPGSKVTDLYDACSTLTFHQEGSVNVPGAHETLRAALRPVEQAGEEFSYRVVYN